jgi:hypothetical protein
MISNECFFLPPDHALAKEFYDLQCIQATFLNLLMPGHPEYDASKQQERETNLALAGDSIRFLQGQYRHERGGDDTCSVSLTYGANRCPLVDGRPTDGSPYMLPHKPPEPVRN